MINQSQSTVSQFINQSHDVWDPETIIESNLSPAAAIRIKNELNNIYKDPVPGILVIPDDSNISRIHALITGLTGTPYEGGYFYFLIGCTADYPLKPPRVKLKTTGFGTVRFNPNFYKNGKVCLSILNTWAGPTWTAAQTLSSVLISIQSLFNDKPYFNEPGFVVESHPGDSLNYNNIIQHETIRYAVCDVLEEKLQLPNVIKTHVEINFPMFMDYYLETCKAQIKYDGQAMNDPFGEKRGIFQFDELLKRLENIKLKKLLVTEKNIQYAVPESQSNL